MHLLGLIAKCLLAALAVAGAVVPLYSNRHKLAFVWSVWRKFRIGMFIETLVGLALTIALCLSLYHYLPFLRWGWMNLFFKGGGNAAIAPIIAGSNSTHVFVRLLVPLFFAVVMVVLPFWAKSEEDSFRKGHYEWGDIAKQSVKFGLIHCTVGIPIAAGIALIGSGFLYAYKYKIAYEQGLASGISHHLAEDEAVLVSTAYHTLWNSVLVALLLVVTILSV